MPKVSYNGQAFSMTKVPVINASGETVATLAIEAETETLPVTPLTSAQSFTSGKDGYKTVNVSAISGTKTITEEITTNGTQTIDCEGCRYVTFTVNVSGGATKVLDSISATYSGGSVVVGTSLDDLEDIVVTAHYTDPDTYPDEAVTGYTLSGEISVVGNNTITATYQSKTAQFVVEGKSDSEYEYATVDDFATVIGITGFAVSDGTVSMTRATDYSCAVLDSDISSVKGTMQDEASGAYYIVKDNGNGTYNGYDNRGKYYLFTSDGTKVTPSSGTGGGTRTASGTISANDAITMSLESGTITVSDSTSGGSIVITGANCIGWWTTSGAEAKVFPAQLMVKR